MTIKNVSLGSDAEVFLRTIRGDPIPVCGMVGGTKEEPLPLKALGDEFFVQEDNAALEVNVPPEKKAIKFAQNMMMVTKHIETILPHSVYPDWDLASCVFDEAYLNIPAMQVFGCEPDYNAYTERANERPRPHVPGFRSAAAHIHIGWDNPTDEQRIELVKLCDVFAVLPDLPYENKSETERRRLYGKAGSFRWKEYGLEHRVRSNRWAKRNPFGIWDHYMNAIGAFNAGIRVHKEDYARIESTINNPHHKLAQSIHRKYSDMYMEAH